MSLCVAAWKRACLLVVVPALMSPTIAQAQTGITPQVTLDVSLPLQHSTNSLLASTNARGDSYTSPDFTLTASWNPTPPVTFKIYADATSDAYSRITSADGAQATLGSQIIIKNGNFTYSASYEHYNSYDRIFETRLFTADEFAVAARYTFVDAASGLKLKPSVAAAYRFADDPSVKRYLYVLKMEVEQPLMKSWSFVSTPKLRFYEFTESTNKGRQDIIASISAGIKYAFSDNTSITTGVNYDNRSSNMPDKKFGNFTIGASLDMTFDLLNGPK
jgi:hypothetical protein